MDKREKIIESARQRFYYYGVKKTTMQEIAKDAGMAVGTLYLYFKDKDDLLVACTEGFVERHRQQAEEVIASEVSGSEKIRRYVVGRYREAERTRVGPRHAAELAREVLRLRPDRLLEETAMMVDYLTTMLKEGMERNEFGNVNSEADLKVFMYSLVHFFPTALNEYVPAPTEAELVSVIDWFLKLWAKNPSK